MNGGNEKGKIEEKKRQSGGKIFSAVRGENCAHLSHLHLCTFRAENNLVGDGGDSGGSVGKDKSGSNDCGSVVEVWWWCGGMVVRVVIMLVVVR